MSRHRKILAALVIALAGYLAACSSTEAAREHERRGLQLLQEGRNVEAVEALQLALAEDPGSYQAAIMLANIARQGGDYLTARRLLEDLVRERPVLAIARLELGDLYSALHLDEQALASYARAAAITPYAPAYLRMARIYERRLELRKAEVALLRALEIMPTLEEARFRLAALYDRVGAKEAARRGWELYVGLRPEEPDDEVRERRKVAEERLRALAVTLSEEEAAVAIRFLRTQLEPRASARAAGDNERAERELLARPFPGRIHVQLIPPTTREVLAATGAGATYRDALKDAAESIRGARFYGIHVAERLERTTLHLAVEGRRLPPFDPRGDASTFAPGRDGLEVEVDGRSALVLPADQVRQGLSTLARVGEAAGLLLGLEPGAWERQRVRRVEVQAFLERGGVVVRLEDGLPAPGPLAKPTLAAAARRAAERLAGGLRPDHWLRGEVDPRGDGPSAPSADAAAQARVVAALSRAAKDLGDPRLEAAARVAYSVLEPLVKDPAALGPRERALLARAARAAGKAEAADRLLGGLLSVQPEPLAAAGGAEAALALAEGALAAGPLARAYAEHALAVLEVGGLPPSAGRAAALLAGTEHVARASFALVALSDQVMEAAAKDPFDPEVLAGVAALGLLPPDRRPEGYAAARARVVGGALRLQYGAGLSWLYPAETSCDGAFREGPFDPRVTADGTARRLEALLDDLAP